ncbi:glycosyltransferase family 15 protein, partial [Collybiopsis luxurians FD-317 M1]
FFYRHELLQSYRWYWHVEPNVKFFCDIHRDPFRFMEENNKVYGQSANFSFPPPWLIDLFLFQCPQLRSLYEGLEAVNSHVGRISLRKWCTYIGSRHLIFRPASSATPYGIIQSKYAVT